MLVSYAKMSQYLCTDLCICYSSLRHLVDIVLSEDHPSLSYHFYILSLYRFSRSLYSFQLAFHMLPQRRQNSSCDPCRRSKRRCFFSSPQIEGTDVACTHCERLGHACTFDFVSSKLGQKKRPRQLHTRTSCSAGAAEASPSLASGDFQADAVAGHDVLESWLDFDYLEQNNECLELPGFLAPDAVTAIETSEDRLRVRPNLQHLVDSSLNSPIRLLNSKLDATILDIRLARIHDVIVTGCASRFADYECNLYATASRYRLGDGDSEHRLLSSNASPQHRP